eukprot:408674_1
MVENKTAENSTENIINDDLLVIGISGSTRSGKSTLAEYLSSHFGEYHCIIFEQDDYFDMKKIWKELGGVWDHPKAINHERFVQDIKTTIKNNKNIFNDKCTKYANKINNNISTHTKQNEISIS